MHLGPRYQIRLGDIPSGSITSARCFACQHTGILDAKALIQRYTIHRRIIEVDSMLRCTACGNRTGNRLEILGGR